MRSPYFVTPNILSCRPNSEESGAYFRNLGGYYAQHSTFYRLSPSRPENGWASISNQRNAVDNSFKIIHYPIQS